MYNEPYVQTAENYVKLSGDWFIHSLLFQVLKKILNVQPKCTNSNLKFKKSLVLSSLSCTQLLPQPLQNISKAIYFTPDIIHSFMHSLLHLFVPISS